MATVTSPALDRMQEKLPSILPPTRRRYAYFVWPYGSHTARAACDTLFSAIREATHAQRQGIADVWIVRSDGYEVQSGCTYCGGDEEALRVASHPALRDYWCTACWERQGRRILNRRLSPLQQDILRWLREDISRVPGITASSHSALVKVLPQDKGNISKSLRNLAAKNFIHIHCSPGGKAIAIQLTPAGSYKASTLLIKKVVTNTDT